MVLKCGTVGIFTYPGYNFFAIILPANWPHIYLSTHPSSRSFIYSLVRPSSHSSIRSFIHYVFRFLLVSILKLFTLFLPSAWANASAFLLGVEFLVVHFVSVFKKWRCAGWYKCRARKMCQLYFIFFLFLQDFEFEFFSIVLNSMLTFLKKNIFRNKTLQPTDNV